MPSAEGTVCVMLQGWSGLAKARPGTIISTQAAPRSQWLTWPQAASWDFLRFQGRSSEAEGSVSLNEPGKKTKQNKKQREIRHKQMLR